MAQQQPPQDLGALQPGQPRSATISPNETHQFHFNVRAGDYLRVVLKKQGVNVAISLVDPQGQNVLAATHSEVTYGFEYAAALAESTGDYTVQALAHGALPITGAYQIELRAPHPPTSEDRARLTAEAQLRDAQKEAASEGVAERRHAIGTLTQAAGAFARLREPYLQTLALQQAASLYLVLEDKKKALEVSQQVLTICRASGDRAGEAYALVHLAAAYDALDDSKNAARSFEQAAVIRRALGDREGEALSLHDAGVQHEWANEIRPAVQFYTQALALYQSTGDHAGEGAMLHALGMGQDSLGDKRKALEYFQQAAQVRHNLGDTSGEAFSLQRLADDQSALGEKVKALDLNNQVLILVRTLNDKAREADALNTLANTYYDSGDKQKAVRLYGDALTASQAAKDRADEAIALHGLANLFSDVGRQSQALEFYNRALPIYREQKDRSGEAVTLLDIANVYATLSEKPKALDFYNQALTIYRDLKDKAGEALALNGVAGVYSDLGEKKKALDFYNQALAINRAIPDHAEESVTLSNIAGVYSDLGDKRKSLDFYNQALPLARTAVNGNAEASALFGIGAISADLGDKQKGLSFYNQALPIFHARINRPGEANTLNAIGGIYYDLGQQPRALEFYHRALDIYRAVGDRSDEANALTNIGASHAALGENQKALDFYAQALPLRRAVGDRSGEARTLDLTGQVYSDRGEKHKALTLYNQALPLRQAVGDKAGEADTLNSIANVYDDLGNEQDSLKVHVRALALRRSVGDPMAIGGSLNNLGYVYQKLGDHAKALDHYGQAVTLFHGVGDRRDEATALNNSGYIHSRQANRSKALELYNQALQLRRDVGDKAGMAESFDNIGQVQAELGDSVKALDFYNQALDLRRQVDDRQGEAQTLDNIGHLYAKTGDEPKALEFYNQALPLWRAIGDRADEALTLSNLRDLFKTSQGDLAILFGKQSINVLQSVRRDNRGLETGLRGSYEKSISAYYRDLAALMVQRQRFGEAEEVLNLLKDKEARDFISRDAVADELRATTLLDVEKKALDRYDQIVGQVVTTGQQMAALRTKAAKDLTPDERAEMTRLAADLAASNTVLLRFLQDQEKSFAANSAASKRTSDFREAAGLQSKLKQLGGDVAAIYTLVAPDRYIAMLVTANSRTAYTTPIKETEFNTKVFEFRRMLQDSNSDPKPLAQELYRIVFPEGLRQDLDAIQAKTIMWSMDSTLRYVPIAALYDGKDYLVTHFRNSLFTPASLANLTDVPAAEWRGIGFGVSLAKENFSALPSVPEELRGIFRQVEGQSGPVPGTVRLDAAFTRTAFEADLLQPGKNVIHIATHFDSRPGVAANSKLLLGDGDITLEEISALPQAFEGIDLLTLSACSTAFMNGAEDGREVDSFGAIAQQLGAKGVIASLWSVNDDATARLMQTMYSLRQQSPALGKSEALRQAQILMASGKLHFDATAAAARGVEAKKIAANTTHDWSHPYFWAPFILIGNWR